MNLSYATVYSRLLRNSLLLLILLLLAYQYSRISSANRPPPQSMARPVRNTVAAMDMGNPITDSYDEMAVYSGDSLHPVCAFANAENIDTALQTAKQWPQFRFWFAVWRQPIAYHTLQSGRIHLIPAEGSTHASGWEVAVQHAKHSGHACEYYFAMDDDLTWHVTDVGRRSLSQIEDDSDDSSDDQPADADLMTTHLIMKYLNEYRPALTVFPWPWGDQHHENMTRMNEKYRDRLVQPVTGFDNGCMIFHHSVVDFFVPVWLGKGHAPKFIVQHTFQNFFAPFLLRGNAIRFNGVAYVNPPVQRHPYDLPFDYMDYFLPASRCEHGRWGPYLAPDDVYWEVEVGRPPYRYDDIDYMATFFNVSHSAIRDHPAILRHRTGDEIEFVGKTSQHLLQSHCTADALPRLRALTLRYRAITSDLSGIE